MTRHYDLRCNDVARQLLYFVQAFNYTLYHFCCLYKDYVGSLGEVSEIIYLMKAKNLISAEMREMCEKCIKCVYFMKTADFHSNMLVSWELVTESYHGRSMKCMFFSLKCTHFNEIRAFCHELHDRKTLCRFGDSLVLFSEL